MNVPEVGSGSLRESSAAVSSRPVPAKGSVTFDRRTAIRLMPPASLAVTSTATVVSSTDRRSTLSIRGGSVSEEGRQLSSSTVSELYFTCTPVTGGPAFVHWNCPRATARLRSTPPAVSSLLTVVRSDGQRPLMHSCGSATPASHSTVWRALSGSASEILVNSPSLTIAFCTFSPSRGTTSFGCTGRPMTASASPCVSSGLWASK